MTPTWVLEVLLCPRDQDGKPVIEQGGEDRRDERAEFREYCLAHCIVSTAVIDRLFREWKERRHAAAARNGQSTPGAPRWLPPAGPGGSAPRG